MKVAQSGKQLKTRRNKTKYNLWLLIWRAMSPKISRAHGSRLTQTQMRKMRFCNTQRGKVHSAQTYNSPGVNLDPSMGKTLFCNYSNFNLISCV